MIKGYENELLRQGTTLITRHTALWTKKQMKENEYIENCMVFANFTDIDDGKSRTFVARFTNPNEALEAVVLHNSKVKDKRWKR